MKIHQYCKIIDKFEFLNEQTNPKYQEQQFYSNVQTVFVKILEININQ